MGLAACVNASLFPGTWAQSASVGANPVRIPIYNENKPPETPKLEDLELRDSVSQYGITWTYETPAHAGQFINGDWYVVGAVTVSKIDPAPRYGMDVADDEIDEGEKKVSPGKRCRNGSMLNLPARQAVAWDSGVRNYYRPEYRAKLPIAMKSGDSLASSISLRQGEKVTYPYHPGTIRGEDDNSPVKTVAVLTCVADPLPPDAFRPGYCGHDPKIYLARNLKRELLPHFDRPAGVPEPQKFAKNFQRPWCDAGFFSFDVPQESMPNYAQWYAQGPANAVLLACGDGLKPDDTSTCFVAQALVLRTMKLEREWNHEAFLDYVDRWMFEEDKPFRIEIAKYCRPPYSQDDYLDDSKDWFHEGYADQAWVKQLWNKFRSLSLAPTNNWKQKHDESYYLNAIEKQRKR